MHVDAQQTDRSGVRQAEIVAALSIATDLGTGHPIERALRACLLSVSLGDALGLGAGDLREIYYVALLRFAGCTADAHHRASLFGDEIALGTQIDAVELWNAASMVGFILKTAGAGLPPLRRAGKVAAVLATGVQRSATAAIAHCEVAQSLANRLGLGAGVARALGQVFERWDGRGVPGRARGEELSIATRVVHLCHDAELFHRLGGVEAAVGVARKRAGGQYDPAIVDRFCRDAAGLLASLEVDSVWEAVLAGEPGERSAIQEPQLDEAIRAIADFSDLRLPWMVGHSCAVAELAAAAATRCGLASADVADARRAGLLHDIGMTGVPFEIWERPGALTEGDWERVRLHPYYTERILARPAPLARLGALAALHHERVDGSGYHRRLPAAMLAPTARILAAADAYQSMIEPRPYRAAYTIDAAAEELRRDVRAGRIDGDAANAVLEAAGHRVVRARRERVAGLSERELEVLQLIARGLSKRQMAMRLTISERTVDHHIRHIYDKIDVSTRAAATLFAMQHNLLDPAD